MDRHAVNPAIEQLTHKNIEALLCHEEKRRHRKPRSHRIVSSIARWCGTLGFFWVNLAFFVAWIGWNLGPWAFDPYPFTFLITTVSLEAIFLSIFILISQNLDAVESERRHHLDLQINLLNERETTALMRLMTEVAARVGVDDRLLEEVNALARDTDPEAVLNQIVKAEHEHAKR
ncbi:DUF1003 domain-containing protein [Xylophilus sp.]|uniref:DUF1003 domain-containing protein n=1 Tax=Xylophilus sp. TaxID=2653893 RepID=UPI0013BD224D|nr:DUF1003 domain-containing protein [Xylophilus sp.]KAF1048422.1 MAG: hypothetical protein GAK38_01434 [Xylophilus sp.]